MAEGVYTALRAVTGYLASTMNQNVNPSTLSGALDVVAVMQEDGTMRSTPFHVWECKGKRIELLVNGRPIPVEIRLGSSGEMYFVHRERLAARRREEPSAGAGRRRERAGGDSGRAESMRGGDDTTSVSSGGHASVATAPEGAEGLRASGGGAAGGASCVGGGVGGADGLSGAAGAGGEERGVDGMPGTWNRVGSAEAAAAVVTAMTAGLPPAQRMRLLAATLARVPHAIGMRGAVDDSAVHTLRLGDGAAAAASRHVRWTWGRPPSSDPSTSALPTPAAAGAAHVRGGRESREGEGAGSKGGRDRAGTGGDVEVVEFQHELLQKPSDRERESEHAGGGLGAKSERLVGGARALVLRQRTGRAGLSEEQRAFVRLRSQAFAIVAGFSGAVSDGECVENRKWERRVVRTAEARARARGPDGDKTAHLLAKSRRSFRLQLERQQQQRLRGGAAAAVAGAASPARGPRRAGVGRKRRNSTGQTVTTVERSALETWQLKRRASRLLRRASAATPSSSSSRLEEDRAPSASAVGAPPPPPPPRAVLKGAVTYSNLYGDHQRPSRDSGAPSPPGRAAAAAATPPAAAVTARTVSAPQGVAGSYRSEHRVRFASEGFAAAASAAAGRGRVALVALRTGPASTIGAQTRVPGLVRRFSSLAELTALVPSLAPPAPALPMAGVRASLCGAALGRFEARELHAPLPADAGSARPSHGLDPRAVSDPDLRVLVSFSVPRTSPTLALELTALFLPDDAPDEAAAALFHADSLVPAVALVLPWTDAAPFLLLAAMQQLPAALALLAPPAAPSSPDAARVAAPGAATAYGWRLGPLRARSMRLAPLGTRDSAADDDAGRDPSLTPVLSPFQSPSAAPRSAADWGAGRHPPRQQQQQQQHHQHLHPPALSLGAPAPLLGASREADDDEPRTDDDGDARADTEEDQDDDDEDDDDDDDAEYFETATDALEDAAAAAGGGKSQQGEYDHWEFVEQDGVLYRVTHSLFPTSEELHLMGLRSGTNQLSFRVLPDDPAPSSAKSAPPVSAPAAAGHSPPPAPAAAPTAASPPAPSTPPLGARSAPGSAAVAAAPGSPPPLLASPERAPAAVVVGPGGKELAVITTAAAPAGDVALHLPPSLAESPATDVTADPGVAADAAGDMRGMKGAATAVGETPVAGGTGGAVDSAAAAVVGGAGAVVGAVVAAAEPIGARELLQCNLYLWPRDARIVVSDVDGTITKSDLMGHVMYYLGRDWTHPGVAKLFSKIQAHGYKIVYLTARAIGQIHVTKDYLFGVRQENADLPDGPVITSPDRLLAAFTREVIVRRPQDFKIRALSYVRDLFCNPTLGPQSTPFYAGFGNRDSDAVAYRAVGIPDGKIFVINPDGVIQQQGHNNAFRATYTSLTELVNEMFPVYVSALQSDPELGIRPSASTYSHASSLSSPLLSGALVPGAPSHSAGFLLTPSASAGAAGGGGAGGGGAGGGGGSGGGAGLPPLPPASTNPPSTSHGRRYGRPRLEDERFSDHAFWSSPVPSFVQEKLRAPSTSSTKPAPPPPTTGPDDRRA